MTYKNEIARDRKEPWRERKKRVNYYRMQKRCRRGKREASKSGRDQEGETEKLSPPISAEK